jgi:hypothetical protein
MGVHGESIVLGVWLPQACDRMIASRLAQLCLNGLKLGTKFKPFIVEF